MHLSNVGIKELKNNTVQAAIFQVRQTGHQVLLRLKVWKWKCETGHQINQEWTYNTSSWWEVIVKSINPPINRKPKSVSYATKSLCDEDASSEKRSTWTNVSRMYLSLCTAPSYVLPGRKNFNATSVPSLTFKRIVSVYCNNFAKILQNNYWQHFLTAAPWWTTQHRPEPICVNLIFLLFIFFILTLIFYYLYFCTLILYI